jgi:hypothetical protein
MAAPRQSGRIGLAIVIVAVLSVGTGLLQGATAAAFALLGASTAVLLVLLLGRRARRHGNDAGPTARGTGTGH